MQRIALFATVLVAAGSLSGLAGAAKMHPVLGAKLSGMGAHGVVNLHQDSKTGKLCWTFELTAHGLTGASIRDGGGMVVARLGSGYKASSCATISTRALDLIESMPGSYTVWVDTKAHVGELRGKLFAGMAHMSKM